MFHAIALSLLAWSLPAVALAGPEQSGTERMFNDLARALNTANLTGRIYYRAQECTRGQGVSHPERLPVTGPPSPGLKGVAAVRDVFRGNPGVEVTEAPRGIVRVRFGEVPDAILRTRMATIHFVPPSLPLRASNGTKPRPLSAVDRSAQYNAVEALFAVEAAPEMEAAMAAHGLHESQILVDHLLNSSGPHLPAIMRNLTADQAIDRIAATLDVIVAFEACPQSHRFHLGHWWADSPARRDRD